jgi:hypothetical protein
VIVVLAGCGAVRFAAKETPVSRPEVLVGGGVEGDPDVDVEPMIGKS